MTLVSMPVAKTHLRAVGDDEDADIELKLEAAEQSAVSYLNRAVYVDQDALESAVVAAPALFSSARQAYDAALSAGRQVEDPFERTMALTAAAERFLEASTSSTMVHRGMVINSAIRAAILLTLGHLYENREDVVVGLSVAEMPLSAKALLRPHRVGVGL